MKADAKCDAIEAKLTEIGVAGTKHRPVCAFITFEDEKDAVRAMDTYPQGTCYYLCQRKRSRLRIGEKHYRLEVQRANDPSDVKWNNLDISLCNRRTRKAIVALLSVLIILCGMFVLFAAKSAKSATDEKYPRPDCGTLFTTLGEDLQSDYFSSAGVPSEAGQLLVGKGSDTQTTGDGRQYAQRFVNWAALPNGTNLTDTQKIDLITCYCDNGLKSFGQNFLNQVQFKTFAGPRLWTYDFFGAGNNPACFGGNNRTMEQNIRDKFTYVPQADGGAGTTKATCTSTVEWCNDFLARGAIGLLFQFIAIAAVTLVNAILRNLMVGFSKWLKFPSNTLLQAEIFALVTTVQVGDSETESNMFVIDEGRVARGKRRERMALSGNFDFLAMRLFSTVRIELTAVCCTFARLGFQRLSTPALSISSSTPTCNCLRTETKARIQRWTRRPPCCLWELSRSASSRACTTT